MKKVNLLVGLFALVMGLFLTPVKALGSENLARIGENEYATLDDAVKEAKDGDVIELLGDVTTVGLNLSKNLTIKSAEESLEKYKVTFTTNGIALWGVNLTFVNVDVSMVDIGSTPYTAEWNWMSICGNANASLILDNTSMLLDGENTDNKHAIYWTGNNILEVKNNSSLTIKNYDQDAVEWDGGVENYKLIVNNSKFVAQGNRAGITGTFTAEFTNANVSVIDNRGNGSNGSHYFITDSTVDFSGNGAHGLSANKLYVSNSVITALNNEYNGIVGRDIKISSDSKVYVKGNAKTVVVAAFRILGSTGKALIEAGATFEITDNYRSGIQIDNANGVLVMNAGVVMNNGLGLDNPYGGGLVNKGTATLSKDVKLYNNHASEAGDDIYNYEGATVTFEAVESDGSDWSLDGGVDCEHEINGWYDDSDNSRWEAHGDTLEDDHIELVDAGTYKDILAVKAAHDKLKGIVIVKYVDSDGVEIIPSIETTDIVGKEYETNKKEFDGYTFITVEGNETGVYTEETIIVIYYYDKNIGNGDIEPPKTGMDLGNINANSNIEIVLYRKEEE